MGITTGTVRLGKCARPRTAVSEARTVIMSDVDSDGDGGETNSMLDEGPDPPGRLGQWRRGLEPESNAKAKAKLLKAKLARYKTLVLVAAGCAAVLCGVVTTVVVLVVKHEASPSLAPSQSSTQSTSWAAMLPHSPRLRANFDCKTAAISVLSTQRQVRHRHKHGTAPDLTAYFAAQRAAGAADSATSQDSGMALCPMWCAPPTPQSYYAPA